MKTEILLVLVCHYNNSDEVERFINSLLNDQHQHAFDIRIAICDNTHNCNIKVNFELVSIFIPTHNLGYMGGCHFAMVKWLDEYNVRPLWVSLTNSDLQLESSFFDKLYSLDLPDEVSIIAPHIISKRDNNPQNPYMLYRPNVYQLRFLEMIHRRIYILIIYSALHKLKKIILNRKHKTIPQLFIYAPHGSAIFFHISFFEKGGTLQESRIFLYGEEIYIAEQCRLYKLKVLYVPNLIIYHDEHTATGYLKLKTAGEFAAQSLNYLREKYWDI